MYAFVDGVRLYIGIANCCALLSYGKDVDQNFSEEAANRAEIATTAKLSSDLKESLHLVTGTHEVVFRRLGNPNVLLYVHLSFLSLCRITTISSNDI